MITVTLSDGPTAQLDGKKVVRIRKYLRSDGTSAANTRIDWVEPMLVIEAPAVVASLVKAELPTLAQLARLDGSPIWFDAMRASGPLRLVGNQSINGARSALLIGDKRQYVKNTHEEVAATIVAAGGTPNPIPTKGVLNYSLDILKGWVSPVENWDPED